MGGVDLGELEVRLQRWAEAHYGADAIVSDVESLPGHAGLSFGFTFRADEGADRLVIRVPPKGVKRRGNTDVLRQVPLLAALARGGVKVAPVRWWSGDERWFDVPFFMTQRLPGTTFGYATLAAHERPPHGVVQAAFDLAVDELVKVHQLDWRRELDGWEPVRTLYEEIVFWDEILPKAAEKHWIALGEEVRALLLAQLPADPPMGVFHGDFQGSNVLFTGIDEGAPELVAVLDWEISGLGGHLMDVGWLMMMCDPESFHDHEAYSGGPDLAALADRYRSRRGIPAPDIDWYRAMAGYRFGVITGLNVYLHRSGKRPDPHWDYWALSVPYLFGRARDLLRGAR